MKPRVCIIILNWNGWEDTIECLESLYRITYPNYDIIIVDNNSKDNSVEKIIEYADIAFETKTKSFKCNLSNVPIKVFEINEYEAKKGIFDLPFYETYKSKQRMILIKNRHNYGYSGGNNGAIKFALSVLNPKYILILNNDTVVDEKVLIELVEVGESNKKAGIMGPTVYHYDYKRKKMIQSAGVKIYWYTGKQKMIRSNEIDCGQYEETYEVDYVSGCAIFAKSELFQKIGYFDTSYFAYWEETEWCIRASKAGYKVLCVPKAKIWHKGGSSSKKVSGLTQYYLTRNKFWFMRRHASGKQYSLFLLYFFCYKFWYISGFYIIYLKDIKTYMAFLRGVKDGITRQKSQG
ncbi:MAG: glycosyltransferase family 2 protein [Candidatus Methanosuratincola petrocarbonis]